MEEKNINIKDKKTLDGILNTINAVLIILFFTIGLSSNASIANSVPYIAINLIVILNLFINPLIEFNKSCFKVDNGKLITRKVRLGLKIALGSIALFMLYKIVFSESIVAERFYWLYSIMVILITISATARFILVFINNVAAIAEEKSGTFKHSRKPVLIEAFLFLIVIIPVIQFYGPKIVISFSNMKLPSGLFVMDLKNQGSKTSGSIRCINITDPKLVEVFHKEISNTRAENVRNLDRINYEFKKSKESYYSIKPLYIKPNGESTYSDNIDNWQIQEIRIYKNGEVLIVSYTNLINSNKLPEVYRLSLPEDYTKEIIKIIELGF